MIVSETRKLFLTRRGNTGQSPALAHLVSQLKPSLSGAYVPLLLTSDAIAMLSAISADWCQAFSFSRAIEKKARLSPPRGRWADCRTPPDPSRRNLILQPPPCCRDPARPQGTRRRGLLPSRRWTGAGAAYRVRCHGAPSRAVPVGADGVAAGSRVCTEGTLRFGGDWRPDSGGDTGRSAVYGLRRPLWWWLSARRSGPP